MGFSRIAPDFSGVNGGVYQTRGAALFGRRLRVVLVSFDAEVGMV